MEVFGKIIMHRKKFKHVPSRLHYRFHCSCFISFSSVHTSLFLMFHLISFTPHLIDHASFLLPSVHSPSHSYLPYLVALILHGHSTLLWVPLFSQFRFWNLTIYRLSVKAGTENQGTEWREWWERGKSGWECGESMWERGKSGWERVKSRWGCR